MASRDLKDFSVVIFDNTREVEAVPSAWLRKEGRQCAWPPYTDTMKLRKAIRSQHTPNDNWEKHSTRLLKSIGKKFCIGKTISCTTISKKISSTFLIASMR